MKHTGRVVALRGDSQPEGHRSQRSPDWRTVMYFHGGGFVLGDRHDWDRLLRDLAHGTNAAIIFVEYSRSPEARYPVAIEEAYAATRWVADNGGAINIDPRRLAVAGDSAGGNLAAAVTMLAKQDGGPKLLMTGRSGILRQCSKPARLAPTPSRDMSVESESYLMIGSRDLEQRIRFESACRSLTSADTFFTLISRA